MALHDTVPMSRKRRVIPRPPIVWIRTPWHDLGIAGDMFRSMPLIKASVILWICGSLCVLFELVAPYIAMHVVILPALFSISTIAERRAEGRESLSLFAGIIVAAVVVGGMFIAEALH